jgi:hypothetical protein
LLLACVINSPLLGRYLTVINLLAVELMARAMASAVVVTHRYPVIDTAGWCWMRWP